MKTFKNFLQLDELMGVAPKAKGEHKFVHSTYLGQIKDPGDLEKVGPEEIGPHDTKMASGKRKLDRLDNKQKFGESVEIQEEQVMDKLHKIVQSKSAQTVKFASGHTKKVDHFTASAITKLHAAAGDEAKKKLSDYVHKSPTHLMKAADLAFKKTKTEDFEPLLDEISEEVPMAARALYAQTYAKHAKTALMSKEAKQKAYSAVEKKHGEKVLSQLKAHHENNMKEESELEEADFSKAQTTMAHAIGKHFKKKGVGEEPYAIATAMVRDKPTAAKKAYATIKAKTKNEEHQDMLMALFDELSEDNQESFEVMLESDLEKLISFAQNHFTGK